jgi:hypothetical protein
MEEIDKSAVTIAQTLNSISTTLKWIGDSLSDIRNAMCEKDGGEGIYVRGDVHTFEE